MSGKKRKTITKNSLQIFACAKLLHVGEIDIIGMYEIFSFFSVIKGETGRTETAPKKFVFWGLFFILDN